MTGPAPFRSLTFGFHPTARGFGWVAFESPLSVYDHGLVTIKEKDKNRPCLEHVERLLERLKPETLVLESFDTHSAQRSKRIRALCVAVVGMAADQGMALAVYTRADVREVFASVAARTRDEIAEAVVRHFPELAVRLPKKRQAGDGEDKRLSLFCAAALVLTHFHFGADLFFEQLKEIA